MTTPLVDLVVPFHDNLGFLDECLDSIRKQGDDGWRAVVIDDGSHDPDAVERLVRGDGGRITVVRHEHNRGVVETFRHALRLATSPWVSIVGYDDRLLPTYVKTVRDVVSSRRCSVVQVGVRVIDHLGWPDSSAVDRAKSLLRPAAGVHEGEAAVVSLMRGNWTYFPSLCWRREEAAAIGFRDHPVALDLGLLVDLITRGGTLLVDDRIAFEYRRHQASVSSVLARSTTRFADEQAFFDDAARALHALGWHRAARSARRHMMSRAHAASLIPPADRRGDAAAVRCLADHVLAR